MMDKFAQEFVTDLFLDSDGVTTMNRIVVAVANVVNENSENISQTRDILKKEYKYAAAGSIISRVPEPTVSSKTDFYENTILHYTDQDYVDTFKMKKSTVETLITYLRDFSRLRSAYVPFHKKVHVFLWILTTDLPFSEVGGLFDLHKSTVNFIFHEMLSLICGQRDKFICWPSSEKQHITRIKVHSRYKFPNCVGFIDTCRFNIGSKRNKRGKLDTVLLQAVCDESLMFIDIHVGGVGSTKKGKVFKESILSRELRNVVDFENHLLGDSQYKLRKNLITPFTSEELLTSEEMNFNEVHWRTHSYIGHAFELLKERFEKINHIVVKKHETISSLLTAACVLHNFVIMHEGAPEIKEEVVICDDVVTIDTDIVKTAEEKRIFLCNYMSYVDGT